MSDLILWVYLADVAGAVSAFVGILGLAITGSAFFLFQSILENQAKCKRCAVAAAIFGILLMMLSTLAPSKGAIYIMAGLKAGDTAISAIAEHPTAQKALTVLDQQLDEMLEAGE